MSIMRSGGKPADLVVASDGVRPSMLEWLRKHKQTDQGIRRFWGVVLISALDELLERTDAQYGVDVFWKAFLANRAGYRIGVPTVPLADLYDGCKNNLISRGGEVRLRATIRGFEITDGAITGVAFESGEVLRADYYVSAVPQDALLELLPAEVTASHPTFENLKQLKTSPITGVHLWFDRVVMEEPVLDVGGHDDTVDF